MSIKVSSIAILVSFFVALLVSVLFYFKDKSLKETASWLRYFLTTCRFLIVFVVVFLMFSPIFVQTKKENKKPILPILIDNTKSIQLSDTTFKTDVFDFIEAVSEEINVAEVKLLPFSNKIELDFDLTFDKQGTNIPSVIDELDENFPNDNIGGALLISDGINTEGEQVYINDKYPIYTIGVGDSVKEPDAKVKNLYFNNIVFVGNTFTTEIQLQFENLKGIPQKIRVAFDKEEVRVIKYTPERNYDFYKVKIQVNAKESGVFPLEVFVGNNANEKFLKNNQLKRFITVKSKKLKILVVSDEPHPDVRAVKNSFWGVDHIDLSETIFSKDISLDLFNAVIFIGNSNVKNKKRWLNKVKSEGKGFVWFTGTQNSFNNQFFKFMRLDKSNDKVQMKSNSSFSLFKLDSEIKESFENSVPISVPFGQWKFSGDNQALMLQKINNIETGYPQIIFSNLDAINYSVFVGSGYWRTSLRNPAAFNELIRKTVNYVSTQSDNSQFRVNLRSEFTDAEEVIINAEYYNEIGDLDNSGSILVELMQNDTTILKSELQRTRDKYRQNIGAVKPGIYKVKSTYKKGKKEIEKENNFFVNELTVEAENLSMNYHFLSELSKSSDGAYFDWKERGSAIKSLNSSKIFKTISYFELISDLLLKFKWIFYVLVLLVIVEWILRKWQGVI